jgi:hypothetical protein
MFKYMVIVYSAAALFLLPCCSKKDAIEGKQAGEAVSSVPVTQPGEAEFSLVRSRLAACAPSEEDKKLLRQMGESTSCEDPKKASVKVFQVRGNLAVLQTGKFIMIPGNAGCQDVYFLLKFTEGKWHFLDIPDVNDHTQPRLVDINNDGFQDIIFFRLALSDGPAPLVTAIYMSGKYGALTKHTSPLFSGEKCESTEDIRTDQYLNMTPGNLGIKCRDGDDMISIEYDYTAGRFVRKVLKEQ